MNDDTDNSDDIMDGPNTSDMATDEYGVIISLQEEVEYAKKHEDKYQSKYNNVTKPISDEIKQTSFNNAFNIKPSVNTIEEESLSRKRKHNIIDEYDGIREICQCPVCFDYNDSECKTCENGHSICSSCFKDLSTRHSQPECPLCRKLFIKYKQTIFNQLYDTVNFDVNCIYDECHSKIKIKNYWNHQKICDYKPKKCIYLDCNYEHESDVTKISEHYESQHQYHNKKDLFNNELNITYINATTYSVVMDDIDIITALVDKKCNLIVSIQHSSVRANELYVPIWVCSIMLIPINDAIDIPMYNISIKGKDKVISTTQMLNKKSTIIFAKSQLEGLDMQMLNNNLCLTIQFEPYEHEKS